MPWFQRTFRLPAFKRGFHLITQLIESNSPDLKQVEIGLAHIFIHHTSASLTINENADPTVRHDFERHFNVMVPENAPYYVHTYEGPDDMPAHIKASLLGNALTVPVARGRLLLGTWQGIYLCEHRDHAAGRQITVTLHGSIQGEGSPPPQG
ncbi:MAG TPA: secondary thiamine-phosphate synthase enzyme YjbQ [Anaerolineae bacterium]|nr:secondary thiamine-phosphate synthase enzyme YjbQ [Anaerolineae bacterium]HMR65649.1 secondary thiamine-phosphate synthase enzyme YjbQ [Anaerolineae bacterium]